LSQNTNTPEETSAITFAKTLAALPTADRPDHFANTVIEQGGQYNIPRPDALTGKAFVTLSLHGIATSGPSEDQAIANWIKVATCVEVAA
jgi:hypothetical protein